MWFEVWDFLGVWFLGFGISSEAPEPLVAKQEKRGGADHRGLQQHDLNVDGREERLVHAFALRYLFRFEAEHLLVRAGFAVEHIYAGFDKSEYGSTYPGELILVARKTEREPNLTPPLRHREFRR